MVNAKEGNKLAYSRRSYYIHFFKDTLKSLFLMNYGVHNSVDFTHY